jgi:FtsP/CotA-like multicopper oxidase with cupredoxin domain
LTLLRFRSNSPLTHVREWFRVKPMVERSTMTRPTPPSSGQVTERCPTLVGCEGTDGPFMVTLNRQRNMDPTSELPHVGATEVWRLIDDTVDDGPTHIHLVNSRW